jgi:hypothetical protein
MLLFESILILFIVLIISFRNKIYYNTWISIFILSIIFGFFFNKIFINIYEKNNLQENMVGSLTDGFENTLKNGVEKFIDEAVKSTSKELVNSLHNKFKDMPLEKKKLAKKNINKIIDNLHNLHNLTS